MGTEHHEQFKRLYDYTKFHVGLYSSLIFGVVAIVGFGKSDIIHTQDVLAPIVAAVFLWAVSGFCGGIILGNMVDYKGDYTDLRITKIGPIPLPFCGMPTSWWENMEHVSFWFGVIVALTGFTKAAGTLLDGWCKVLPLMTC